MTCGAAIGRGMAPGCGMAPPGRDIPPIGRDIPPIGRAVIPPIGRAVIPPIGLPDIGWCGAAAAIPKPNRPTTTTRNHLRLFMMDTSGSHGLGLDEGVGLRARLEMASGPALGRHA
jgi:hypothetical protein